MPSPRGWVSVSVQTYQSHRTSAQRILQQEYTVDESGATLNALLLFFPRVHGAAHGWNRDLFVNRIRLTFEETG